MRTTRVFTNVGIEHVARQSKSAIGDRTGAESTIGCACVRYIADPGEILPLPLAKKRWSKSSNDVQICSVVCLNLLVLLVAEDTRRIQEDTSIS